jgi:replicative DNA helicase
MSELTENTFTAYLGPEFQQRLMWQILVEPEFAEKIIPELSVEYFDDPNLKRLFLIILEYFKENEKVPNLQNQSINSAIYKYKTPNNIIEEESLFSVIKRIELWNERVLNKQLMYDGDIVQREAHTFIKQQELRKLGEFILMSSKNGDLKKRDMLSKIDDSMLRIANIGTEDENSIDATENIERALRKEFRETIPTGIVVLDAVTGGGLGKGEIGLILTPTGVGKTTLLTKIANTARELDYNVLQIIFEDTAEQIQRKHSAIWSGVKLSDIDDNNEEALQKVSEKITQLGNKGKLTIKKFSQEDTTMKTIRNWIVNYQKKHGFKYDIIVLDYLDCVDSHKKVNDRNEAELIVIKSFEAMASDFNIPCWTAIQTNRTGIDAELVEAHQTGGNIKRTQKAHFFMSVAKTPDQKEAHLANIRIIKARFAHDGQTFKDCIFNNDTMQIIIKDDRYVGYTYGKLKKYGDAEIDKLEKKTSNLYHTALSNAIPIEPLKSDSFDKILLNDMANKFKEQQGIKDTEIKIETIGDNIKIIQSETIPIINNEIIIDVVNNTNSDIPAGSPVHIEIVTLADIKPLDSNDILGWTGETFTSDTNISFNEEQKVYRVELENIKPSEVIILPKSMPIKEEIQKNVVTKPHSPPINNIQSASFMPQNNIIAQNLLICNNLKEAESMFSNPDEAPEQQKNIINFLDQMRKNQKITNTT